MRRHVPKIKKGNLRSNVGKMFSSSKKLPKAQSGKEIADASEMQAFHPMFHGNNYRRVEGSPYLQRLPGTNYVTQVFGTGPGGVDRLHMKDDVYYDNIFPGAPDPNMYGGNQRKYIRALNRFEKDMLKDYRDLYTGGVNPTQTSTSRLRAIPGTQEYLDAANKLHSYVNSEIQMINQANELAGRRGKNKRTKGKGNKNRLFR